MKPKIFIVEDETDIIELYRLAFEDNGMELESASTGIEGLEKLRGFAKEGASKPDMILLDLLLPDISGIDILKEVKKTDELKNIPLIALTNYGSGQIHRLVGDGEFKDVSYLIKIEITPQQLVDYVKKKINFK